MTRVRDMVKHENEPLKNKKWASAAQKHKVGHLGTTVYTFILIYSLSTTGQLHEVKLLDDITLQYKAQLNKLLNALSGKITEAYTLEKKTTEDMTMVEDKVQHMNDEVDRIVEDQVWYLHQLNSTLP